jgi:hypothetical protein
MNKKNFMDHEEFRKENLTVVIKNKEGERNSNIK